MILNDVKEYVRSHQQVSLSDLVIHFDVEPEAVRGILDFWVRKGKIKHIPGDIICGSSCSCSHKSDREMYAWNQQLGNIPIQSL